MLSSFPGLPAKSFLKPILHSNENDNGMKFQFRFAWNARSSPAFGPTDQRRLAGTTVMSAAPMTFVSRRSLIQQQCTRSSLLQRWDAVQEKTLFIVCKGVTGIYLRDRTCLEKDTK